MKRNRRRKKRERKGRQKTKKGEMCGKLDEREKAR